MARLGRGQPFAPKLRAIHIPNPNGNVNGLVAAVSVQAYVGTVSVSPPAGVFPFVPGQAIPGDATPGMPGQIANPNGNVNGLAANVAVAAPMGTVSVTLPGPVAPNVAVAPHMGTTSTGASEAPANVAVAAPTAPAPQSTFPGPLATVSVQAWPGTPSVTLPGPSPANVAVAALPGVATTDAVVLGAVASISVQAYPGTVSVSTPRPPGASVVANPAGAGNSTLGWAGLHSTTFLASSSPPAGCPEATAFEWVDDGIAGGGHAIESAPSNLYPAVAGGVYTISAWVYSSAGSVQIGFDWRNSGQGFISGSVQTIAVPANTWTLVTTTQTAVASTWYLIARVGSGVLSSTVWATDIFVTGAPQVSAAAPMGTVGTGASEAPANITVAAPMGTVSVNTFGPQVIGASSFDAGNLDGWGIYPAGSSAVASNLWSHSGDYSDLLTANGSTASPSTLKTFTFPGGSTVTQGGWLYSPQGFAATLGVDVYTSGGTYITSFSKAFTLTAGVPQYCQLVMYMPANAGQGHFRFIINGTPPNTNQLFVDDALITITPAIQVAAQLGVPAAQPPSLNANVAVTAPMGTVSVTLPGPVAPNVAAAAPVGTPVTSVNGLAAGVSVFTPGQNLETNPFFTNGSIFGWSGFHGTLTGSTSPPAGCPYPAAVQWVNDGVSAGAIEGGGSGTAFTVTPSTQYSMGAWVYTSLTQVQIGFDWLTSGGGYLSTSSVIVNVPANTWTWVSMTAVSNASAARGYTRVGSSLNTGETVWATGIQAWNPATSGQTGLTGVSTPGSTANVNVAAPMGTAVYIPPVIVSGPAAPNVSVVAPAGGAGGGATNAPAGVTVQAYFGAVSVSAVSPGSHVTVVAVVGRPGSSVAGATAHVTEAAPAGHASTSVTVPPAGVATASHAGSASVTVAGRAAAVAAGAPAGTVRITLPGPVAGVSVGAQPGTVGVSATASASCTVAAPRGSVGTSVAGQAANIGVSAPVSPLVAGLYLVTAEATMEFSAGGVKQRRVWFGYGATNVMNTTTPPPKG